MTGRSIQAALRLLLAVVLLAGAAPPHAALGQDPPTKEYEVKAAFLYNFTKFVTWSGPAPPDAPFVIGVLGEDPFGEALAFLEKKTAQGRPIVVQRADTLETQKNVRVLFISSSVGSRLPSILRAAHAKGILTVGDADRFAAQGGIIELVLHEGKVGFEINVDSAKKAGLTISSKLLSLARYVHREGGK